MANGLLVGAGMNKERDLSGFSLGHPCGLLSISLRPSVSFGMTTIIAAVDGEDAVIAADGLMQYRAEPYNDCVVKIMVLSDSLLVGFMSNSLESVCRIQGALVPEYAWDESKLEDFCSQWNRGTQRVKYGYRNAVVRITKALREITGTKGYDEGEGGCGLLLVGKRKGQHVVAAWETSMGCKPREATSLIFAIGSKPEEGTAEYEHFERLVIGDKTTKGWERRLVAGIRYCALDLKLPAINGNVATCRMSEKGKIRWHLLNDS